MKCDKCFFCTHIGKGIYADYAVKYCKYRKIHLLPFVNGRKLDFNKMEDCKTWSETGCNIHPRKVKKAKEDFLKSLAEEDSNEESKNRPH